MNFSIALLQRWAFLQNRQQRNRLFIVRCLLQKFLYRIKPGTFSYEEPKFIAFFSMSLFTVFCLMNENMLTISMQLMMVPGSVQNSSIFIYLFIHFVFIFFIFFIFIFYHRLLEPFGITILCWTNGRWTLLSQLKSQCTKLAERAAERRESRIPLVVCCKVDSSREKSTMNKQASSADSD